MLAFDYESLNTAIEQTARDLKQRLAGVGLSAGHGKTLHIVAPCMGGLVSRWFIEREGGADTVQKFVMLGTPNGGMYRIPSDHMSYFSTEAGLRALVAALGAP